jgi:DNA invertase Pin-like site-specific DNA recombinase
MKTGHPRRAYSYLRYSTPEQGQGDSIRRQLEATRDYAKNHGLDLDESLKTDKGISAFKGKNRTEGSLGAFLADCRSGRVPRDSVLLVESLDRLSREEVEEALYQFLDIIRAGIEIRTLSDGQIYRKGTLRTEQLMVSLFVMSRANEESVRKSERVGAAWKQKKASTAIRPGVAITAKVPLWIKAVKGEPMELIQERAKVVRQIFRMSLDGLGAQLIAQELNEHHKPFTDGGTWHKSYVEKILRHPATYGAYQPCKRGRHPAGDLVLGYFPAVIDYATWQSVQQARDTRYRQRKGTGRATMRNLFAGLVTDATHKLPMVYYMKGNEIITDSYRLSLKPHRIPYADFERSFLWFLDQLDWTTVLDVEESDELSRCEKEIASLVAEIALAEKQVQKITDLLLDIDSKSLRERLLTAESGLETAKAKRDAAEKRLAELRQHNRELLDESVAYSKLAKATDLQTRVRLREEIRRKVKHIKFWFRSLGDVATIEFTNGATRLISWMDGKIYAISPDSTGVTTPGRKRGKTEKTTA